MAEFKDLKDGYFIKIISFLVVKTLVSMVNYEPRERPSALEIGFSLILSK